MPPQISGLLGGGGPGGMACASWGAGQTLPSVVELTRHGVSALSAGC